MERITEPGVYDIEDGEYHADPVAVPSLSNSIAVTIVTKSCMHAWDAHPRLNPHPEPRESNSTLDNGSAAHELILRQKAHRIRVIRASDWRKKEAKAEREEAWEAGAFPVLEHHYDDAVRMAKAVRRQLAEHDDAADAFTNGRPEQTMVWREGDTWFRAKADWLGGWIDDLKTTGGSAEPGQWIRSQLIPNHYDMQEAFYRRGARALGLPIKGFRFIVIENTRPFALSVVKSEPARLALAHRKVEYAISKWRECMRTGVWPGYPRRTAHAELPPWEESRWMEREFREAEEQAA